MRAVVRLRAATFAHPEATRITCFNARRSPTNSKNDIHSQHKFLIFLYFESPPGTSSTSAATGTARFAVATDEKKTSRKWARILANRAAQQRCGVCRISFGRWRCGFGDCRGPQWKATAPLVDVYPLRLLQSSRSLGRIPIGFVGGIAVVEQSDRFFVACAGQVSNGSNAIWD